MKRDGNCTSLWQDLTPDFKTSNNIPPSTTRFDVVIVGGGITGVSTALELQKKGKSVLLCESHNLGFGTTGGTTAHINTVFESPYNQIEKDFGEKNAQLAAKAAIEACELIKSNVQEYGIDCAYKELPAWLFAQDDKQAEELDEIYEATAKAGVSVDKATEIPVNVPFKKAIIFAKQAQFHPIRYIYALATEFESLGGIIIENCMVTGVEETDVLQVHTTRGHYRATNVVYATHIPPGVNLLHFRCAPYRSYAMAVKLRNEKDYPKGLAYDMYDAYHYFRTQVVNGQTYMIVGGEDHKTGHEDNPEMRFTKLESYVRNYYDVEEISFKWSSQYFNPTDGLAYIGHLPGHPHNIFVATGFGGNGMTYSHIAAVVLRDLILTGENEYRKLFDPNRIKPVAGFSDFVKESADVVGHLIRTILPKEKLNELADMAPGEGKVVNYEGHAIALYKDEAGNVHALSPACSHIKCSVGWNAAEKSWDCPCHGSRYAYNGEVLTAPARKPLAVVHIEELVEEHK
jgi:glycine/D-amino acid oxidase-like deaminating enzyme/nitrite reductase/ring-hydroxylating ferredoxin subunit